MTPIWPVRVIIGVNSGVIGVDSGVSGDNSINQTVKTSQNMQ